MSKIERTTIFFCLFIIGSIGVSTVQGDPWLVVRSWFNLMTSGYSVGSAG